MYAIDFNTCTAEDVIRRSVVCHPSLYVERFRSLAATHAGASATMRMRDKWAADVAARLSAECSRLADRVESGDRLQCLTFGERISAFSLAATLQCLPRHVAQDIIDRRAP